MALTFDPMTGRWIDDEDPLGWGQIANAGGANPFLGAGLGVPSDLNKYGEAEPYDVQTLGRQGNATQDIFQMMFDPRVNYYNAVVNGADTFDFGALLPGGGVDNAAAGAALSVGGAGAGGGFGGASGAGGTGAGVYTTAQLDAMERSDDEVLKEIATQIRRGVDPATVKLWLRQDQELAANPDNLTIYDSAIDDAWTDQKGSVLNQAAGTVPKPSATAEWYAKTGLPDPNEMYSADNLPADMQPDVQNNRYLLQNAQRTMNLESQLRQLQRDAIYMPEPHTPVGVLARQDASPTVRAQSPLAQRAGPTRSADVNLTPDPNRLGGVTRGGPITAPMVNAPSAQRWASRDREPDTDTDTGITASIGPLFGTPQQPRIPGTSQRSILDYLRSPEQRQVAASGMVTTNPKTGQKARTNQAGARASAIQRRVGQNRQLEAGVQRDMATVAALAAQQMGRSPAKDRMQQQVAMLRSMGIGV